MEFNPYSIPLIISLLAIVSIGILAFKHNPSSSINKSFFYFCLSLCIWLLAYSLMYNSKNETSGLFWARMGFLGILLIPLFAYIFVNRLLSISPIPFLRPLSVFILLSIPFSNSNLIYAGIKKCLWGFYPVAGKLYFVYTLFFAMIFLYCIQLFYQQMNKIEKNNLYYKQIKYVFFAFILGSTGIVDFVAKYPVYIYPFGWLSALLFISLLCYAILKYQIEQNELLRQEIAKTEKLKAVATLASSIAHEIKNPLTSLGVFIEYMPQRRNDPEFLEQYQKLAQQEIERIDHLLKELLDFAKPSIPQMKEVNPNEIIQQLVQLIHKKCDLGKITIEPKLEANTGIQADPNQLKQALLNLMLNAIDAMPDGGILKIDTNIKDQNYIITITDTGYGIDPKDIPHIFEPFYTKKEKGTGLGLAITQGIIEKHGGKIAVKSKTSNGTKFTITLSKICTSI